MPTFLFLAAICLLVAASILLETDAVGPSSSGNAEPKAGNTAHKANASDVFEAMFRFDEANAKAAAVGTGHVLGKIFVRCTIFEFCLQMIDGFIQRNPSVFVNIDLINN
uniref:Uncharacterized protein n=1 Tax=Globodera rostochiensis TaxID=31243 RepID=A0A914H5H6_GLORO